MSEVKAFAESSVRGFLHVPEHFSGDALVLTHGAGSNCQAPLLVAVADAFSSTGVTVLRCDLPFRQRRSVGPPVWTRAEEDRLGLAAAVAEIRKITTGRVLLGGHSYGGRQASILATEQPRVADGLLLLSYPLHPPNKPQQLRTAHFTMLSTPLLFVHGTRDPFGTVPELEAAIGSIPARSELSIIEGAGHDLKRGKFDLDNLLITAMSRLRE